MCSFYLSTAFPRVLPNILPDSKAEPDSTNHDMVRLAVIDSPWLLTLASPLVCEQLVALLAAAFEGADRVAAEVITAAVVFLAFIDVWVEKCNNQKEKCHPKL